ncbi:hypothetical protein J4732_19795 [Serratia marcescens]|uniref:Uncharacterized protein n=1 Tax=Serratia marcescens TaxID=615 RepID=A0A939NTD8_SERMA|nr:hypothetical protein [Serratia marcescens]
MEEIAADFSYETVRLSDRVLSWTSEPAVSGHQRHQRRARVPAGAGRPRDRNLRAPAIAVTWTICCCPTCCNHRGPVPPQYRRASTSTSGRPA